MAFQGKQRSFYNIFQITGVLPLMNGAAFCSGDQRIGEFLVGVFAKPFFVCLFSICFEWACQDF